MPRTTKKRSPQGRWPRWIARQDDVNLRAVAPSLYVGAELSPGYRPDGKRWYAVVDLYGESSSLSRAPLYQGVPILVRAPFSDGRSFPPGYLDAILATAAHCRSAKKSMLIHCQAGLSRSASAAYAMLRVLDGLTHDEALRRVKLSSESRYPMATTLRSARRWVKARKA